MKGSLFGNKQGWLYCFRTVAFTSDNYPIYKVGRTGRINPIIRLQEHVGMNRCSKLLFCSYFDNISIENNVLHQLRQEHSIHPLSTVGREYFTCTDDNTFLQSLKLAISECEFEFDGCETECEK